MNLAEKLLAERLKQRSDDVRTQYAEIERLCKRQYENGRLREQLNTERKEVEKLELSATRNMSAFMQDHGVGDEHLECQQRKDSPLMHAAMKKFNWWHLFGRPWSHVWRIFLLVGTGVCVTLGVLVNSGNTSLHALYAIASAALVPTTICVFLGELSRHTGPGLGLMSGTFVIGGVISIGLTLIVDVVSGVANPVFAGLVEEPCKGLILLVLFFGLKQFRSPLSGLSFGAAVGAGFASFETFIYAYRFRGGGLPSTAILLLRGVLSPLAHTAWTSAFGGAVWSIRAAGNKKRRENACWSAVFILCGMIICHGVFNYNATTSLLSQSTLYISLLVWGAIFHYIEEGLKLPVKG